MEWQRALNKPSRSAMTQFFDERRVGKLPSFNAPALARGLGSSGALDAGVARDAPWV